MADMIFNETFGDRVDVDSGRGKLKCDELLRRIFFLVDIDIDYKK